LLGFWRKGRISFLYLGPGESRYSHGFLHDGSMITNQKYVRENIGSTLVRLTPEEVKAVRQMADKANAANDVGHPLDE
jgi:hypothetical protein